MKYLSLDLETTGTNPNKHKILQIGCVFEDTYYMKPIHQLPALDIIINNKNISGNVGALSMNANLIKIINEGKDSRLMTEEDAKKAFVGFLIANGFPPGTHDKPTKITCCGKNFSSFDLQFLKIFFNTQHNTFNVNEKFYTFSHKNIDIGSRMIDFNQDEEIPGTIDCAKRADIENPSYTHDAVDDAKLMIEILRTTY